MKRLFSLFLSIIISASVFCVPLYSSADTEKVQLYYTSVADSSSSSTVSFKVDVPEGVSISGGLEMHITYDTEIFTVSDIEAADRSITHNIKTITDENDDTVPSGVFSIIFDSWDGAIESDITLFIFKLSYEEGLTSGLYEFPFNNIYCFDEDLNHIPFEYNGNISLNAAAVEAEFSIYPSEVELDIGDTYGLATRVYPQNFDIGTVSWSSNSVIASVSETGVVTALDIGTATITATTSNGLKADCTVTITELDPVSIVVVNNPDKTSYQSGEYFDDTGLKIEVTYSDESTRTVSGGWTIETDGELIGTNIYAVLNYRGVTFTVPISVEPAHSDPNMAGIEVSTLPNKTNYITQVSAQDYFNIDLNSVTGINPDITGLMLARIDKNGNKVDNYFSWSVGDITTSYSELKVGYNDINVSFDNFNTTYPIFIDIVALNVCNKPNKLKFTTEEKIDFSGLEIMVSSAYYDFVYIPEDGEMYDPLMLSADDFEYSYTKNIGKNTVTATYDYLGTTLTLEFEIEIYEKSVTGIEIISKPTKTEFPLGVTPDFEGLQVQAIYNDGEKVNLTSAEYTVDYSGLVEGESTITVKYNDFTANFTVTGYKRMIESLSVNTNGLTFKHNTDIDFSNVTVTAVHNDGYTTMLNNAYCEFTPNGKLALGEHEITVKYNDGENDIIGNFSITVTEYYNRTETTVSGIAPGITASEFCSNANSEKYTYKVFNGEQEITLDTKLSTGNTVKVYDENGKLISTITAIIKGDVNGDSYSNTYDISTIQRYIVGSSVPQVFFTEAADVTGDGVVDVADVIYLKRYVLNWSGYEL